MPGYTRNEELKRMVLVVLLGLQLLSAEHIQQLQAISIYGQAAEALVM